MSFVKYGYFANTNLTHIFWVCWQFNRWRWETTLHWRQWWLSIFIINITHYFCTVSEAVDPYWVMALKNTDFYKEIVSRKRLHPKTWKCTCWTNIYTFFFSLLVLFRPSTQESVKNNSLFRVCELFLRKICQRCQLLTLKKHKYSMNLMPHFKTQSKQTTKWWGKHRQICKLSLLHASL